MQEDLTERNQPQKTVVAAHSRPERLLTFSPAVIYSREATPDYRVTFVSENVKARLGYEPREFMDDPLFWSERIHPEYRARVFADLSRLSEQGHAVCEYRYQHKDGSYRWMHDELKLTRDKAGMPYELVGCWIDITDRKRAEEALQESEERCRIVTQHVADGVMVTHVGRLLFVNDAFVSMFGYTDSEQLVGKEFCSLVCNCFKELFEQTYQELEARTINERILQGLCHAQDGQEFWVKVHNSVVKWKGKLAVLSIIKDITESRAREIAVQEEAEYLRRENIKLRSTMKERFRFGSIIGKSPAMQQVYELILKASSSEASVLIWGESGTGKELVAQAIHDMSARRDKACVPVNCGAIPEPLLESEFFGHKKGAFTGAYMDKHGYLDLADGGTLFLDEVGDLGLNMQVKLLRAIEGGGYTPVGSRKTEKSDFRIICATNKNLRDQVNRGLMREDFFYRIHVIPIHLPPLRDRREDIILLIEHFTRSHNHDKKPGGIPAKTMEAMYNYDWPGNVRELQNVLHRYFVLGRLDFMDTSIPQPQGVVNKGHDQEGLEYRATIENFERDLIVKALEDAHWKRAEAASVLGIPRRTLSRKMKRFGLM